MGVDIALKLAQDLVLDLVPGLDLDPASLPHPVPALPAATSDSGLPKTGPGPLYDIVWRFLFLLIP